MSVEKMNRKELPKFRKEENIPFKLKASLFGGLNDENNQPVSFGLDDVIQINRLYHNSDLDTVEMARRFKMEEHLIRRIIIRFDAGDFDRFLKNFKDLDVLDLEEIDFNTLNFKSEILEKLDFLLFHIKQGKSLKRACSLADFEMATIRRWFRYGKKEIMPYYSFYKDFKEAREDITLSGLREEFEAEEENRRKFLNYIQRNISLENIIKLTGIDMDLYNNWLDLGKDGIEPFDRFYKNYNEAVEFAKSRKR
mgnify:CR=1 FL=1